MSNLKIMSADTLPESVLDLTADSCRKQDNNVCSDCASPNSECISRQDVLIDYGRMAPHQRALRALMNEDIESFRSCLENDPEVREQ
jgi:hypothetical protein